MRTGIALVIAALALTGCAATPADPEPLDVGADPAALVAERYGDCLADLDATEPSTSDDGTTVIATIEGAILTWDVGQAPNTGDPLTIPADTATIAALESVGC